jgi:hypothetical protein
MSGFRIMVSALRRNVTKLRKTLVSEIDGAPQRLPVVRLKRLHRLGVDVIHNHDAGDAGLDFKGLEDEAFGGALVLAGNHATGNADGLIAVAEL